MRHLLFFITILLVSNNFVYGQNPVWTHNAENSIQTLSNGSIINLVESGPETPWAIAFHKNEEKMYWTNVLEGTIKRAGSGGVELETVQSGLDLPRGLAIDADQNLLFWVEGGHSNPGLRKMDLADESITDLITESIVSPYHIALDRQNQHIYWIDNALGEKAIRRTDYEGNQTETIISSVNQAAGLTVIPAEDKLLWGDFEDDIIYSAETTGQDQNITTVIDLETDATPWAIFYDDEEQIIYWTDYLNESIHQADTDGTDSVKLADGIIAPSGINAFILCPVLSGGTLFVKKSGDGSGVAWNKALPELRDALDLLSSGVCTDGNVDQIWVASGVYAPVQAADVENVTSEEREESFHLINGVELYGGFHGAEDPSDFDIDDRKISEHPTVLTGNIVDPPADPSQAIESPDNLGDYSYSVVTASGTDNTAELNGFTITGGHADAAGGSDSDHQQSGGAIYIDGSNPELKNLSITGNAAHSYGGGIFSYNSSNPVLINLSVYNNLAANGGGLANVSSSPAIIHTTLSGNSADDRGGGIYNYQTSQPSIINSVLWNNAATTAGDQLFNENSTPGISNSLIEGSGGSSNWDLNLGTDNGNNLDESPLFVDVNNNNFSLGRNSPAIDGGTLVPFEEGEPAEGTATDLTGDTRLFGLPDLGAYESGTATTVNGEQGTEDWRFLASPVVSSSLANLFSPFWTQGIPGADHEGGAPSLYFWDAEAAEFTAPSHMSNEATPGQGYIKFVFDDQNYDDQPEGFPKDFAVVGAPNPDEVDIEVISTNNGDPQNQRWNLLGNPFGFSLNVSEVLDLLDQAGGESVQINRNIYIWNPDKERSGGGFGAYQLLEDNPANPAFIPPFQSFFVRYEQTFTESETVTFNRQNLTESSATRTLLGKEPAKRGPITNRLNIELLGEKTGSRFQLIIDERIQSAQSPYNAYRLMPLRDEYALLYAEQAGHNYSRIHLPSVRNERVSIPLNLSITTFGRYAIRWNGVNSNHQTAGQFRLVDNKTGKKYELNQAGEFLFEQEQSPGNLMKTSIQKKNQTEISLPEFLMLEYPSETSKEKGNEESRFTLLISAPGESLNNSGELPEEVSLKQNYPNPFNPSTRIEYAIPEETHVRLEVYDIIGRRVSVLVNENIEAGSYNVTFNAGHLSSGIYIYKLEALGQSHIKKFTLIK